MAFAYRTDITVPIMTPTDATHPDLPTPNEQSEEPQYNPESENSAAAAILSDLTDLPNLASTSLPPLSPIELDAIKAEAQSLIDTNKFTTKKAFKALLDEEMAKLVADAEMRARKRSDAVRANENVEDEVRQLEARYETERRALAKRMMGK